MFILLKRFIPWVAMILVILVAILGINYFWRINGSNLVFGTTHSEDCKLARLTYQKGVAEKIGEIIK